MILLLDEAKEDEDAIGFPSMGINLKEPSGKTKVNNDLKKALQSAKFLTFDACFVNKTTGDNPLVAIMSYLYYGLDFGRLGIQETQFFNFVYAIQELYFK